MCPQCQKRKATIDREFGILPCDKCQKENEAIPRPTQGKIYDFASPTTKIHRKQLGYEMYQPYVNGVLSKEFVETYGTDRLAGVSKKDIKNAKYTYGSMTRHHKMMENGMKKNKTDSKPKDYYKVKEHK